MSSYVLGNFFIYVLINAFTPGPGNILALNTVTEYGCKKGKPLFIGIFIGYEIHRCCLYLFSCCSYSG